MINPLIFNIYFYCVALYFLLLWIVAMMVARKANALSFYIGNKNSNPYLITVGMLGTSLSGISFISVPGTVPFSGLQYAQLLIGYAIGYIFIAFILMPLYYKLQVVSIYEYLKIRFNVTVSKTGALFFIVARFVISSLRLYLILYIIYYFVFENMHLPFGIVLALFLVMMFLYTYRGGVKVLVWTDTLQTLCMLIALIASIYFFIQYFNFISFTALYQRFKAIQPSPIFNWDITSANHVVKQIVGALFITFAMTGLDQEMMQKCLSIHTLKKAKQNIFRLSILITIVNLFFLLLGIYFTLFAQQNHLQQYPDNLYPFIAFHYFPSWLNLIFVIGIISTAFPSIDGAITAITTSFCIDIFDIPNKTITDKQKNFFRHIIHLFGFLILAIFVLIFLYFNNKSLIYLLLNIVGYIYAPLLALFVFGLTNQRKLSASLMPYICVLSLIIMYGIQYIISHYTTYRFGLDIIFWCGLLCYVMLYGISKK